MADIGKAGVHPGESGHGITLAGLTHIAGALVSLALVGGVGAWGYGMIMRDVSGVPVVRALEGPMREAPEEPGGRFAAHQGLSVNRIAADGAAAAPSDRVIIAPPPLDLLARDIVRPAPVPARETARTPPPPDTVRADIHLAVIREEAPEPVAEVTEEVARAEPVSGGIGRSLRPRSRPATADPVAFALAALKGSEPEAVDPASLPPGTRLAQLGAFESAEVARAEWKRLSVRLGDLLQGKSRVIQKAESGGRTFYRLRAVGFADLAEARRFCSALMAEKADCVPVVTR